MTLLHDLPDFADLIAVTARAQAPPIDPSLVEKELLDHAGALGPAAAGVRLRAKERLQ
jgi:hypothetical protein